jgi:uncharacterized protein YjbI with pentapeptide repeats
MSDEASGPALPGEECRVPPRESWSDLEKWVWHEIGSGRIADINAHLGKTADSGKPDDWGTERRLSPAFLETILLHDPWRSVVPHQGIHMVGAKFAEPIDLKGAKVSKPLLLDGCHFIGRFDMTAAYVESLLSLDKSIGKSVELSGATCHGPVFMRHSHFQEVGLRSARIQGQLNLRQAVINKMFMGSIHVIGDLFMDNLGERTHNRTVFGYINLVGARICGQAKFTGAVVTCLNMDSVSISGSLLLDNVTMSVADLHAARITGQIAFIGAKVNRHLDLGTAVIGQDIYMRYGNFQARVIACFARIGGNFDGRAARFSDLDLTGATIAGELRLSGEGLVAGWHPNARIVLCNANVGVIQDDQNVWPEKLDLEGFTYGRFGGFGADAEAAIAARGKKWFTSWLAKNEPYTPQPYQQCAKVLREMGHPEMADAVLYAGRERDRKETRQRSKLRWLGLGLLKSVIGYGYGRRMLWRPLGWVIGLTAAGTAILHLTGVPREPGGSLVTPWFFSFDLLLPIIQLYEPHYQVVLEGVAKYYFAFHKLMGYLLAAVLGAGLAGLTK